jgi:hypothetical protein
MPGWDPGKLALNTIEALWQKSRSSLSCVGSLLAGVRMSISTVELIINKKQEAQL